MGQLRKQVDPSYDINLLVKTGRDVLGVRVPTIRNIVKARLSGEPLTVCDAVELMDICAEGGGREEMLAGVFALYPLKKRLGAEYWPRLVVWLEAADNWEVTDQLAKLGGEWVALDPGLWTELVRISHCEGEWHQRFAIACTATLNHAGRSFPEETFEVLLPLIRTDSPMLRKALGWALREVSKNAVEETFEFLRSHRDVIPRTVLTQGMKKLPSELQQNLREATTN